ETGTVEQPEPSAEPAMVAAAPAMSAGPEIPATPFVDPVASASKALIPETPAASSAAEVRARALGPLDVTEDSIPSLPKLPERVAAQAIASRASTSGEVF